MGEDPAPFSDEVRIRFDDETTTTVACDDAADRMIELPPRIDRSQIAKDFLVLDGRRRYRPQHVSFRGQADHAFLAETAFHAVERIATTTSLSDRRHRRCCYDLSVQYLSEVSPVLEILETENSTKQGQGNGMMLDHPKCPIVL